ncbi:hypothetical protein LINGRAHAP2_LOCUS14352 [Linum grandiflorum]
MVQSEQYRHRCEAIVKVAGTEKNRGRAFYRCQYRKDKSVDCGYFKWVDELHNSGDAEMVYGLHNLNEALTGCTNKLQRVRQKVGMLEDRVSYLSVSIVVLVVACSFIVLRDGTFL